MVEPPEIDPPGGRSVLSALNNVFFVVVLIAMAIGGVFLALNKL